MLPGLQKVGLRSLEVTQHCLALVEDFQPCDHFQSGRFPPRSLIRYSWFDSLVSTSLMLISGYTRPRNLKMVTPVVSLLW